MEEQIELHVRGGGLVAKLDRNIDAAIYLMSPRPEVLFWGQRVFRYVNPFRYEEALAVTALSIFKRD